MPTYREQAESSLAHHCVSGWCVVNSRPVRRKSRALGYRVLILACNQLPLCSFWFGPIVRECERMYWGYLRHEMRGYRLKDGDNALEHGANMRHPWVMRVTIPL